MLATPADLRHYFGSFRNVYWMLPNLVDILLGIEFQFEIKVAIRLKRVKQLLDMRLTPLQARDYHEIGVESKCCSTETVCSVLQR